MRFENKKGQNEKNWKKKSVLQFEKTFCSFTALF
jgi:hypothetical protein